jgi:hypothetical protein
MPLKASSMKPRKLCRNIRAHPLWMPVCLLLPRRWNTTRFPATHAQGLGWQAGHKQALSLLDQTLQQEEKTDADLSKIAETAVNAEAE